MRNRLKKICVALAILAVMACADCANRASAAEQGAIRVAAAADLKFTMDEIVEAFRRERPAIGVQVTYGSSGNFYAQRRMSTIPAGSFAKAWHSPTASSCMA